MTTVIVPEETDLTRPYWEGARLGELRVQRCGACGHVWHPPLPRCPRCAAGEVSWVATSGRGVVHATTVVHQAAHPAFADRTPYLVVVVRLAEGPLVIGNVLGAEPSEVAIGDEVVVVFEEIAEGVVLPQFALSSSS
jgi:uncharacterized OB-fold protein